MLHSYPTNRQSISKFSCRLGGMVRAYVMLLAFLVVSVAIVHANQQIEIPVLFGDNMVLQRGKANPVWGWFTPGGAVKVSIERDTHEAQADKDGRWEVILKSRDAGGPFTLTIQAGEESKILSNIMFGEVWLCSGQSNMNMPLSNSESGEEAVKNANHPNIRIIKVPRKPVQELQKDFPFPAKWGVCSPETVPDMSALAYYFAKDISENLNVPVGIIQIAAGGSSIEAWIERKILDADERFEPLMSKWRETESHSWDAEAEAAKYQSELSEWEAAKIAAERDGKAVPRRPSAPVNPLESRGRPGNFYGGMLSPAVGYGIRGVLWYQGESNAGREAEYALLFPTLIKSWREAWKDPNLPFFWVQLASFGPVMPVNDGSWAGIREAQGKTLTLPNTGQVVTTDLGDAKNIHPLRKKEVGDRLAQLVLAEVYQARKPDIAPFYENHKFADGKAIIQIGPDDAIVEIKPTNDYTGFVIAGEDKVFRPAKIRIIKTGVIEVSSDKVAAPVAVRYSWADNPPFSVFSSSGLPLAPFRTDSWDHTTFQD